MMSIYEEARRAEERSLERCVNEISHEDISLMLRQPEVLPCAFDGGIEFWLERISLWGRLDITHIQPNGRKEKITKGQVVDMMYDDTMLNAFGKWSVRKLSLTSVELYRDYVDAEKKKRHESIIVDIDLKQSIKNVLQGK